MKCDLLREWAWVGQRYCRFWKYFCPHLGVRAKFWRIFGSCNSSGMQFHPEDQKLKKIVYSSLCKQKIAWFLRVIWSKYQLVMFQDSFISLFLMIPVETILFPIQNIVILKCRTNFYPIRGGGRLVIKSNGRQRGGFGRKFCLSNEL